MSFKIPDGVRKVRLFANGVSAASTYPGYPSYAITGANPDVLLAGIFTPSPSWPATTSALSRRFMVANLDLTGVSNVNVSMVLATPTNTLGGSTMVFGNTVTAPLVPTYPSAIAAASIRYNIKNQTTGSNYVTGGYIVQANTTVFPSAGGLSPTSPYRVLSPYNIPIPASAQTANVSLEIFQSMPGTGIPTADRGDAYRWAVDSITLGANNGGTYIVTSNFRIGSRVDENGYLPAERFPESYSSSPFTGGMDIVHVADPKSTYTFQIAGEVANTKTLVARDRISFSNVSITTPLNTGYAGNQFNLNNVAPFRGTYGTMIRNPFSAPNGIENLFQRVYRFSSDTVIALQTVANYYTLPGTVLSNAYVPYTTGLPLVPQIAAPAVAGSWYYGELVYREYASSILQGHSDVAGYNIASSGSRNVDAAPVPYYTTIGELPGVATSYGPLPTANRIRGSSYRFPFSNMTNIAEVVSTSPTITSYSTFSSKTAMFAVGGAGPTSYTFQTYYYQTGVVSSTTKYPFAAPGTTSTTTIPLASLWGVACTDEFAGYYLSTQHRNPITPTTLYTPSLGATGVTDHMVLSGVDGYTDTAYAGALSTNGALFYGNRRMIKAPYATDVWADWGDLPTPVGYAYNDVQVASQSAAASPSSALFTASYGTTTPGVPATFSSSTLFSFPFAASTGLAVSPYTFGDGLVSNHQSPDAAYGGFSTGYKFNFSSMTSVRAPLYVDEIGIAASGGHQTIWSGAVNIS